jgi:hypothetical protein
MPSAPSAPKKTTRRKTSVTIDPDLARLVRKRMPDFDMNFSDALEEALRLWLRQNPGRKDEA